MTTPTRLNSEAEVAAPRRYGIAGETGKATASMARPPELHCLQLDETGVPTASQYGGNDTVGLGGGNSNRLSASGKMKYTKRVNEWFDTSMLTAPAAAWLGGQKQGLGRAGKDAVVGANRVNLTTSLDKSFAMTERAHFELRFESFNTFNHTELNNFNDTLGNGLFGQITSTWDPRVLELGGKFVF